MLELTANAVTQTVETIVDVVLGIVRFVLGLVLRLLEARPKTPRPEIWWGEGWLDAPLRPCFWPRFRE